jgi:hypothetical protein
VLTDPDGDVATSTLTVNVADDAPTARNDTDALAAKVFTAETGNVITAAGTTSGAAGADTLGADGATVTRVASAAMRGQCRHDIRRQRQPPGRRPVWHAADQGRRQLQLHARRRQPGRGQRCL